MQHYVRLCDHLNQRLISVDVTCIYCGYVVPFLYKHNYLQINEIS